MKIQTVPECDAALYRLLQATLRLERLTAERDTEVAKIQHQHSPAIQKSEFQIATLQAEIEAFYRANRDSLEDGKKSLQLSHGLLGMRSPSNPSLVPLSDKWNWDAISEKVRSLWKSKYFHKPKPPALDKVKLKKLDAAALAKCGLKLDTEEQFHLELNRLAVPDEAAAVAAEAA